MKKHQSSNGYDDYTDCSPSDILMNYFVRRLDNTERYNDVLAQKIDKLNEEIYNLAKIIDTLCYKMGIDFPSDIVDTNDIGDAIDEMLQPDTSENS